MGVLDEKTIGRITSFLRHHPKGLMISDLSSMTKINRNIMAKYLEILLMSGQVEMAMRGNAKVYTLSRRAPLPALFESSSDCIVLLDGDGKILWVNAPVLMLTGKDAAEFAGKAIPEIDDPLFAALPCGEGAGAAESVSEISCTRAGEPQYYRVRQVPAVLADGSNGSILSCENVTTEVVFQQMVEISEARFRAIVEDQTEFIARFLPDGTLTFANGSFARSAGKQPEELTGTPFFLHIHPDDVASFQEKLRSPGPDHAVATLRCRGTGAGGQVRRLQWTVRALFDKGDRLTEYQAVGRDITSEAEAVGRLRQHAEELEFIARKIRGLMELPKDADLYAAMADDLSEMLPGTVVAVSSITPSPARPGWQDLTIRNVCGIQGRELFKEISGIDLVGFSYSFNDPAAIDYIRREGLHTAFGDLYTCLFGQVPYLACKKIEDAINLGDTHIHALVSEGQLIGEVAIYSRKGETIENPGLIEAFIRQASLVLSGRMANEGLQKSEAQFRAIVEEQTESIVRFLPDGTLTFVNESFARLTGRRPEELTGTSFYLHIGGQDAPRFRGRIRSMDPGNAVATIECRGNASSGAGLQQWTVRALFDKEDRPAEYLAVGRDVTGEAEAVGRLRQHAEELEFLSRKAREFLELQPEADIYNAILYGLREIVPGSTITICSFDPHATALVGRGIWPEDLRTFIIEITGGDFIGRPFLVRDPEAITNWKAGRIIRIPGDLYSVMFGMIPITISRQIEEKFSMGGDKFSIGLVSRDRILGAVLIIPHDKKPLRHHNLIETYLQQASIALAQRVDADALRQSEERFRSVIENQTEFVTRFLPDGTLTFANAPLCRAVGMEADEMIGRSFFTMIPGNDRQILESGLRSLTRENPSMTIEHRSMDAEGRIRWFQWTNRAIFDERGQVVEYDGIGRDVTGLHEAAERIRRHPADIRFLSRNARALAGLQNEEAILSAAAQGIRSIVPGAIVGICWYDQNSGSLSFRCLEGSPEDIGAINHELGQDLMKSAFAMQADKELSGLFSGKRLTPAPGHIGFLFRPVSPDICTRIGERCNLGRSYMMGLPSQDGKIGAVLVQLKAGTDVKNPELVEAAIAQAGLALSRPGRGPD